MTPAEIASVIVAYSLAASRIIPAAKEIWSRILPPKLQWLPGAAIIAATTLVESLRVGVASWTDLTVPILLAIGAIVPGARSATHAAVAQLAEESVLDGEAVSKGALKATGNAAPVPEFPPPSDPTPATSTKGKA